MFWVGFFFPGTDRAGDIIPGPHQNRTTPGIIYLVQEIESRMKNISKSYGMGWESWRFKDFVMGFG